MTEFDNKTPNAQLLHDNTVLPKQNSWYYLQPSMSWYFPIPIYYADTHWTEIQSHWSFSFWYWIEYMWPSPSCLCLSLPLIPHHVQWMSLGSYIVSISDISLFSITDVDTAHQLIWAPNQTQPMNITVVLAPECHSNFDDHPSPTQLCLHDLYCIATLWFVIREGIAVDICQEIEKTCHL